MSLWRKRKTSDTNCDTIAPNVHHNGQNQPKWANMTALANNDLSIKSEQKQDNLPSPLDRLHEENVRLGLYEIVYDLSIKSDDLSIKSEKAMCEVQRLGQEIEQEPVAWYRDENGIRIYYETKVWDDCTPLYTTPQQRTWVGLTDEEIQAEWLLTPQHDKAEGLWFGRRLEAKLKEKNT
jgi:hypothetical protein